MSEEIKSVNVRVIGRVQGVSFRAWTQQQAEGRGLSGWVRNDADGSVEALISGPEHQVDAMVGALFEGPMMAHVEAVETNDADPPEEEGFEVRH